MPCKNRITLIGFLGQHAETRYTPNGTAYTRFSIATSVSWKVKETGEYSTRTEWHRVIGWNKLGHWAANLQKGAYVEVEGELRYREFTPAELDRSVRVPEVYASSILLLDRSDRQAVSEAADLSAEEPIEYNPISPGIGLRIDARFSFSGLDSASYVTRKPLWDPASRSSLFGNP